MNPELSAHTAAIVSEVRTATAGSPNEASLRHELEAILERHCRAIHIPWTPFQLDRALGPNGNGVRFVDVAHGAVVIEYEAPSSFGGREGAKLRQAQQQAGEYTRLLQREEGRLLSEYVLVAWDGSHISFGRFDEDQPRWEPLGPFDDASALRLLLALRDDGAPLVHPLLLAQVAGPDSPIGIGLLPRLFEAVRIASTEAERATSKTRLLFTEWRRLFGQVVGVQSDHLRSLLARQGEAHGQPYDQDAAAYLFALNTYIALVAKLVAAMALPNGSQDLTDPNTPVEGKMAALESGRLFADAGVTNMLTGDFFSWYLDDAHWASYTAPLHTLITHLSAINFDVTRKDPDTTRDLFKGLYQSFVPRALRHALGEYYTPDWLAAHALDVVGWQPGDTLLDPTCGSGTFVLEALRQRLAVGQSEQRSAQDLLDGLYGIDLNPLAVLAARSSLVVYLAPYLDPFRPVRLPIYLADAINSATAVGGVYRHSLQTAAIPPVQFIVGNPPWVKWSHLPPDYAAFIKDRCLQLGVFSEDRWVGGIESDISTIVTYEAIDKWLAPGGRLAFFITATVFSTESSEGFRRFHLRHRCLRMKVLGVEDFDALAPFEGVTNHPALLMLERDAETVYPAPYRVWKPVTVDGVTKRSFLDLAEFYGQATYEDLLAQPVPGTEAGPWLKGTLADHQLWQKLFGADQPNYRARKGVTADRNGIFFVKVLSVAPDGKTCRIQNDPSLGRQPRIAQVTAVVEAAHVFPLLRGRGVNALSAQPDAEYCILLPQRGMHGDPELPVTAPLTHRFLSQFLTELEARSSYRRFQQGQPYWSLWSTGSYTFSPFKVVWREISGQRFAAAYVGSHEIAGLGDKLVIPDHKLYFVPVDSEEEAAYLTGLLNAPIVTHAINAYAAQLSLGVSVVEYLNIPSFARDHPAHQHLAGLAQHSTREGRAATADELREMDALVDQLFGLQRS